MAAGLYVHLPYCRSRCGYCAFVVSTDDSSRAEYVAALEREAALVGSEAEGVEFDSIYFGGGTPSLTPPADLERLLSTFARKFRVASSSEITLEANPDDVTSELARAWRRIGITRISVGVQSFQDRELAAVGRRHDARTAERALELLIGGGFSVSADLILGLPDQTPGGFRASSTRAAAFGVDHLSVYLLETDKSKAMEEDRRSRPERYLSDDAQAELWLELSAELAARGFVHYEISNWCRPGYHARHNVKYWEREPTLGFGVSAHELWGERRRANASTLPRYIAELACGRRPSALDRAIDLAEREREELVLGLRLARGVPADAIVRGIRSSGDASLPEDYVAWRKLGWIEEAEGRVRLTERGFLVSNEILCRFA